MKQGYYFKILTYLKSKGGVNVEVDITEYATNLFKTPDHTNGYWDVIDSKPISFLTKMDNDKNIFFRREDNNLFATLLPTGLDYYKSHKQEYLIWKALKIIGIVAGLIASIATIKQILFKSKENDTKSEVKGLQLKKAQPPMPPKNPKKEIGDSSHKQ